MPIIFPFTEFGTIIATAIFFGSLIYCGLTCVYLDGEKNKKHRVLRISVFFAALLMFYCEYSAVNIGFTLNPPNKANIECKG